MIASLAMYDFDDLLAANDALWGRVRGGLRALGLPAPDALTRGADLWDIWQAPDLLLAQTCGYPFRARLHPHVTYIGTPDYGVQGCPSGYYCSVFIANRDDPRTDLAAFDGVALAYNDPLSQSGWAAAQTHAAGLGLWFRAGLHSGSHLETARAVAAGRADLGAVDAVSWRHIQRVLPSAAKLTEVARTAPTPGLPLITAKGNPAGMIFDVVAQAIAGLDAGPRTLLGLRGLVAIPTQAYLDVPNPPPPDENP